MFFNCQTYDGCPYSLGDAPHPYIKGRSSGTYHQYRLAPAIKANAPVHTIFYIAHKQKIISLANVTITKGGITVAVNINDPMV